MAEPDPPHGAARRVHGAEERRHVDIAAGVPLVLVDATVELGADLPIRPLGGGPFRGGDDRLVEAGRRALEKYLNHMEALIQAMRER